jgi:RNA ligase
MAKHHQLSHFKFRRTPHLPGSAVVDDDETASWGCLNALVRAREKAGAHRLLIDEKVDGANVSVHFEQEWTPLLQKRSGLIGSSGEHTQVGVAALELAGLSDLLAVSSLSRNTHTQVLLALTLPSPLQYNVFREWTYSHAEELFAVLGTEYVLFGEWLWCKHGVA